MPTLNKPRRKHKSKSHGKCKEIANLYNSTQWVKLRKAHIMQNPLCEQCLIEGKTKLAEEVHHIRPISTGADELEMMSIAYDPYNLMSLCVKHHHEIHKKMNKHI